MKQNKKQSIVELFTTLATLHFAPVKVQTFIQHIYILLLKMFKQEGNQRKQYFHIRARLGLTPLKISPAFHFAVRQGTWFLPDYYNYLGMLNI